MSPHPQSGRREETSCVLVSRGNDGALIISSSPHTSSLLTHLSPSALSVARRRAPARAPPPPPFSVGYGDERVSAWVSPRREWAIVGTVEFCFSFFSSLLGFFWHVISATQARWVHFLQVQTFIWRAGAPGPEFVERNWEVVGMLHVMCGH